MQLSASTLPFDFTAISPADLGASAPASPTAPAAPDAFGALLTAEAGPAASPAPSALATTGALAPFSLRAAPVMSAPAPADAAVPTEDDGEESSPAANPPDSDPAQPDESELPSWLAAAGIVVPALPLAAAKPAEPCREAIAASPSPLPGETLDGAAPDTGVLGQSSPRSSTMGGNKSGALRSAAASVPGKFFARAGDPAPRSQIAAAYARKAPVQPRASRFAAATDDAPATNMDDLAATETPPPSAAPQSAPLDPAAVAPIPNSIPLSTTGTREPPSQKSSDVAAVSRRFAPASPASANSASDKFSRPAAPLDPLAAPVAEAQEASRDPVRPPMDFPCDVTAPVACAPAATEASHPAASIDFTAPETVSGITPADTRSLPSNAASAAPFRFEDPTASASPAVFEAAPAATLPTEPAAPSPAVSIPVASTAASPESAPAEISLLGISATAGSAGEKIAVDAERSAKVDAVLKKLGIKNSVSTADKEVTGASAALGINVAKTRTNMPALASASNRPSTDVAPATFSAPVLEFAAPAEEQPQAAMSEASSAARRTVESVLAVTDHFTTGGQHGVNLKFSVSGIDLAVRVEVRGGNVQATFRTDSPELRAALATEWHAVAAESSERAQHLAEPVFTSSAASRDSFQGDLGASDQRGSNSRSDHPQFAESFAPRSTSRPSAALEPAAAMPAVPLVLPGRLHALA